MRQQRTVLIWLSCLVAILAVASLVIGIAPIAPGEIALALRDPHAHAATTVIVQEIRMPRTVLALLLGAGLGMTGAALQALLRNPLAEPGIIGVSACSALGAVTAFYTGLSARFALALPLGGMLGAFGAVLLLYGLVGRRASTLGFILAGVAINSLGGALTALALSLSPNPYAAYEVFFWLMGSLADRSWQHVTLVLPFALMGMLLLARAARALDVLALGDDVAATLGVSLPRLRAQVVAGTALLVGPGVAVAGVIGFVGLIVPHLLRRTAGHRAPSLLWQSAFGGAALLLAADIAARLVRVNGELKLGVVTALVGAPFFLYLVSVERRGAP